MNGAHQPGGELGAQGERAAAAVVEGVHLLRHDVGGLPHPAGEDGGVLEDRRLDVAVAGPAQRRGERVADGQEARGVRRQDVERALRGAQSRSQPAPLRRGPAPAAASARYGLVARSRPIVVAGAVPGQHDRLVVQRQDDVAQRGAASRPTSRRAGRPGRPSRRTARRRRAARGASPRSTENITEPWVWPGACRTVSSHAGQRQHRAVVQRLHLGGVGQPHPGDQRRQRRAVPAGRVGEHAEVVGCR